MENLKETNDSYKATVLVVDDQIENIIILEKLLTRRGYEVITAHSGSETLEIVKAISPDIILLDIMMPEMDGYEVCSILKNDAATKGIPIIFVTAVYGSNEIVKGFELGAVDYIVKPYNLNELHARLNTHIELKFTREKLEKALEEVKTLQGILPLCSNCRKIRKEKSDPKIQKSWIEMEEYIEEKTDTVFSHSLCPSCITKLYPGIKSKFDGLE